MSGGTFDYSQYQIDDVVEEIERRLKRNNLTIAEYWETLSDEERQCLDEYDRLWDGLHHPYWLADEAKDKAAAELGLKDGDWDKISDVSRAKWYEIAHGELKRLINEHNNSPAGTSYSAKTVVAIREMLSTIRKAKIYIQRIDWLFAGDDGEDSFHKRVEEDLKEAGLAKPPLPPKHDPENARDVLLEMRDSKDAVVVEFARRMSNALSRDCYCQICGRDLNFTPPPEFADKKPTKI